MFKLFRRNDDDDKFVAKLEAAAQRSIEKADQRRAEREAKKAAERLAKAETFEAEMKQETPAAQRLLWLLLEINESDAEAWASRAMIAARLGRPSGRLTEHDRALLEWLVKARSWVKCRKAAKPLEDWRPRGWQYEYRLVAHVGASLQLLRKRDAGELV